MFEDEPDEEQFNGNEIPAEAQGGNTGGTRGGQPPRGRNIAGGDDLGDSSSSSDSDDSNTSPPNSRDFPDSRKRHLSQ